MKKIVSILLCMFLMFSSISSWQATAEDTPELYYLWDIPFGISESEFIEQAYAKTGFNFVPHSGEAEESFQTATDKNQSISFLGYPLNEANALFEVNSDGTASYYAIALFFTIESKTISQVLSLFDSVRMIVQEKYGDHTFAALSTSDAELLTCDAIEGDFNAQQVAEILTADDAIHMVILAWNNLGIYVSKTSSGEVVMILIASAAIQEAPKPLEVYENRNLPSDAGL